MIVLFISQILVKQRNLTFIFEKNSIEILDIK